MLTQLWLTSTLAVPFWTLSEGAKIGRAQAPIEYQNCDGIWNEDWESADLSRLRRKAKLGARIQHLRRFVQQSSLHTPALAVHTRLPTPFGLQAQGRWEPSRSACCDGAAVLLLQSLLSSHPCRNCRCSRLLRKKEHSVSIRCAGRISLYRIYIYIYLIYRISEGLTHIPSTGLIVIVHRRGLAKMVQIVK